MHIPPSVQKHACMNTSVCTYVQTISSLPLTLTPTPSLSLSIYIYIYTCIYYIDLFLSLSLSLTHTHPHPHTHARLSPYYKTVQKAWCSKSFQSSVFSSSQPLRFEEEGRQMKAQHAELMEQLAECCWGLGFIFIP